MKTILLTLLLFIPLSAHADLGAVLNSKTCVQFLADSRENGAANAANLKMVQAYLTPFGFDKTAHSKWHISILVNCVVNKQATLLDGVKILITELYDETLI